MDPQILMQLISNTLQSTSNPLRHKAQTALLSLYSTAADETINTYLDILSIQSSSGKMADQTHQNKEQLSSHQPRLQYLQHVKRFIAVQLRNILALKPRPPYINVWPFLTEETRARLKKDMMVVVREERDRKVSKMMAGNVGRLAGNLIVDMHNQGWPQFRQQLQDIFTNGTLQGLQSGFHILQSFYQQHQHHHKDILPQYPILTHNALKQLSLPSLVISAMKCFCSYLKVLPHQKHHQYQGLLPQIYAAVEYLVRQQGQSQVLHVLDQMVQLQPFFFKASFPLLMQTMVNLFDSPKCDQRSIITLLSHLLLHCPSLFKSPKHLASYLDMSIMSMLRYPYQTISNQWLIPPQGFKIDENQEHQITMNGADAVNNVIEALGVQYALEHVENVIERLMGDQRWNYQYNGLFLIGQLGDCLLDQQKITSYLTRAVTYLDHIVPLLRYAALQCLGLFMELLPHRITKKHAPEITKELLEVLYREQTPRVVSHVLAALTNSLQHLTFNIIELQFCHMVGALLDKAQSGISIVKETSMTALISLVQISQEHFSPYLKETLSIVIQYFSCKQYDHPCYTQLRDHAVQLWSHCMQYLPEDVTEPYFTPLVQILLSSFQMEKCSLTQIVCAWQKLAASHHSQKVQEYIDQFVPQVMEEIETKISDDIAQEEYQEDTEEEKDNKDNREEEENRERKTHRGEVSALVSMLKTLCSKCHGVTARYLKPIVQILSNLLRNYPSEPVRKLVCQTIPSVISSIQSPPRRAQIAKFFISDLVLFLKSQTPKSPQSPQILTSLSQTLQLFKKSPLFSSKDQLMILTDLVMSQLELSEQIKSSLVIAGWNMDQDQVMENDLEMENLGMVQLGIIRVLGIVVQTYKEQASYLAQQLMHSIMLQSFLQSHQLNPIKAALFIISDMVEYIPFHLISQHWPTFQRMFSQHLHSSHCAVRQVACFGLGMLSEKTPRQYLRQDMGRKWLDSLCESIRIQRKKQSKLSSYKCARDNAVAALGRVMKTHLHLINIQPYIPLWLVCLPLTQDQQENPTQIKFLVEIIEQNIDIIIIPGEEYQILVRLFNVFGWVLEKKIIWEEHQVKMVYEGIMKVLSLEYMRRNTQKVMESIDTSLRQALGVFFQQQVNQDPLI